MKNSARDLFTGCSTARLCVLAISSATLFACSSADAPPSSTIASNAPAPNATDPYAAAGAVGTAGAPAVATGNGTSDSDIGGIDLTGVDFSPPAPPPPPEECEPVYVGIVRDFQGVDEGGHPDFEIAQAPDELTKGMVMDELKLPERLPQYAGTGPKTAADGRTQINGPDTFAQWYTDVPGVNMRFEHEIPMLPIPGQPGLLGYDDDAFFPIDGMGFGASAANPEHNYHFTFELHMQFTYNGGEQFTFKGDDDLWVFINNKLAIDLGGLHQEQTQTADLDLIAGEYGLTVGETYPLDLFHAERHTYDSHFRVTSSIKFVNCTPILPVR